MQTFQNHGKLVAVKSAIIEKDPIYNLMVKKLTSSRQPPAIAIT